MQRDVLNKYRTFPILLRLLRTLYIKMVAGMTRNANRVALDRLTLPEEYSHHRYLASCHRPARTDNGSPFRSLHLASDHSPAFGDTYPKASRGIDGVVGHKCKFLGQFRP